MRPIPIARPIYSEAITSEMSPQRQIRYNPAADYYRTLDLSPSASIDEIHRVYRARAKEVHPDAVHPSRKAWATRQFQQINEAHDVLGDPASKAEYDKQRFLYLSAAFRKTPPPRNAPRSGIRYRRKRGGLLLALMITIWLIAALFGAAHSDESNTDDVPRMDMDSLLASMPAFAQPTLIPCDDPNTQITSPKPDAVITNHLDVRGTAAGPDFVGYTVELENTTFFPGSDGGSGHTLVDKTGLPVRDGDLASTSALSSLFSGNYTLRLTVKQKNGTVHQCEVGIFVVSN